MWGEIVASIEFGYPLMPVGEVLRGDGFGIVGVAGLSEDFRRVDAIVFCVPFAATVGFGIVAKAPGALVVSLLEEEEDCAGVDRWQIEKLALLGRIGHGDSCQTIGRNGR
jgi:hypothetical protein